MATQSKVVMITGASAGVGRAVARAFAREGAHIGLLARGIDGLNATAREVRELGGDAIALQADVADADQVELAAATLEDAFGPIDIWINNAMVSVFSPVRKMTSEEFRRVTEVTYLGYVYGTLAALRRMEERGAGVIVQVGSALAYRGIPLQSAYCAAKHAIQGFTESLRAELIHEKSPVRVSMVQMPALNTPQFDWNRSKLPNEAQPIPPIFQPELAADAVLYAAHHERAEMYVGWPSVKAITANRIAPRLLDRVLARTGYTSQQTEEPRDPTRPDNLFHALPGDRGAHGRFDDVAHRRSGQWWADKNRSWLAAGALLASGVALGIARARAHH